MASQEKQALNREFHNLIGGRKRDDLRFFGDPEAVKIRGLITEIQQRRKYEGSLSTLASEIGITGSILSLAVGGRAGKKPRYELGGLSSTEFIIYKLSQINQPQP